MNGILIGLNTNYSPNTDTLFYGRANGVNRIATLFRNRNHNVEVLDYFNFWSYDDILHYVTLFNQKYKVIDFVGIGYTFSDMDIDKLNMLLFQIKKNNPNCKFFSGGYGVFYGPTTFHKNGSEDLIDIYMRGFADGTIEDLEKYILTGKFNPFTLNTIPNKNGIMKKIVDCNKHYKTFDLHRLKNEYVKSDYINPDEPLVLETCRGCIFKCKFCSFELIGKKKSDNYIREKNDVKSELIENYKNWGTYKYIIADDTFNDNPFKIDMLYEISQEIDFKLEFWAFLRADLLYSRPDSLKKMMDFGLRSTLIGIETLNQKTGITIGKGFNGDKLKKFLLETKEKFPDLNITGTFILGLPHESIEVFRKNIDWAFNSNVFENVSINQLMIPLRNTTNNHPHNEFTDNWHLYGYKPMTQEKIELYEKKMGKHALAHRFKWDEDRYQYMAWENEFMNMYDAITEMHSILNEYGKLNKNDSNLVCFSNSFDGETVYNKGASKNKYNSFVEFFSRYVKNKFVCLT